MNYELEKSITKCVQIDDLLNAMETRLQTIMEEANNIAETSNRLKLFPLQEKKSDEPVPPFEKSVFGRMMGLNQFLDTILVSLSNSRKHLSDLV